MLRQKSAAQILVGDGAGGMRPVDDLRFEPGDWPVHLRVPARRAVTWMAQLDAECEARGYPAAGLSQLDAAENTGTTTVRLAQGPNVPAIDIVWERARDKNLLIRARPSGDPSPSVAEVRSFLVAVTKAQRAGRKTRAHRWAYLTYTGLPPWRGELWLNADLCLGPPTIQAIYLNDPMIIIVDAMIEGIGSRGLVAEFERLIRELSIFLHVVVGIHADRQQDHRVWINSVNAEGHYINCELRQSGYYELPPQRDMPVPGQHPPVRVKQAQRPGLGRLGIWPDDDQAAVPQDVNDLWHRFQSLPEGLRQTFLQAGNAFANAHPFWPAQRTAYVSFLVVACEALKPSGRKYDRANAYDVLASFLGAAVATSLRQLSPHPQGVRSGLFHRGDLVADELVPRFGTDHFQDPSFDSMIRELAIVTRTCLIEWLRCDGRYAFRWMPRPKPTLFERLWRAICRLFD
jgi:hypothetical protein